MEMLPAFLVHVVIISYFCTDKLIRKKHKI